jgi:oligopeptide/dipeptide ABC transporter ATP-binding protein
LSNALLEVDDLHVHFHTREGVLRAVNGVSYQVFPGETLGIVGESGSGKSVLNYAILGLTPMPPGRIAGGRAVFEGTDLLRAGASALRRIRGRRISVVFQDPMTALNPYMAVGRQVAEALLAHGAASTRQARARALEILDAVGIQDAAARYDAYPHAFSGGMRQRVMIAMALVTRPALLIADEPTTALDVTVQAQILERIRALQAEMGMAVVLITHDLAVAAGTCTRMLVMYAGQILESGPVEAIFARPSHPYTRALLDALPAANRGAGKLHAIAGQPPDPLDLPAGCPFAPRCAHATPVCATAPCGLAPVDDGHATACIRVLDGSLTREAL